MTELSLPPEVQRQAAQAERHTTPCGDGDIVWHVWGEARPDARPLVLLHGGSGSWTHWVRNIDALVAAGHQLWVPDLPGFGDSAAPASGGDADALVAPLHEGLRALLGSAPCDLVGFSFGGMTAGLLLAAHPGLAQRLVLVGAPAMGVVLNAGAYTHTSVALLDAIKGTGVALIELHISNVHARESFRHHSYIASAAKAVMCGFGVKGYGLAIDGLAGL